MEVAILAAGCFWGVQYYFDQVPGVTQTSVGYSGGHTKKPNYQQVCTHTTGHAEAVRIEFDPAMVTFNQLLKHYFRMHDPTQLNRQGYDIGDSYRSAIFYTSEIQHAAALEAIKFASKSNKFTSPIVTEVKPSAEFWPAEDYHQKFAERTGRGICHTPYQKID